jgi:hypothetical protein
MTDEIKVVRKDKPIDRQMPSPFLVTFLVGIVNHGCPHATALAILCCTDDQCVCWKATLVESWIEYMSNGIHESIIHQTVGMENTAGTGKEERVDWQMATCSLLLAFSWCQTLIASLCAAVPYLGHCRKGNREIARQMMVTPS